MAEALLVAHQLVPDDIPAAGVAGDERDSATALTTNAEAFDAFATDLQASGSKSHETDFVRTAPRFTWSGSRAPSPDPGRDRTPRRA